ncbi:aldose epimerase family protein [Pontiella sulfatireligans]|uniref:Aldose 1-epimerase n=1 Tax=Pontiella sulfatireligans TaxID=2750658 RepID=A0A6C2UFU2_9BACT|nr:aldose epimerase family protein [Pontiella sulfatireligans]VGO19025.1 Aldose 1-epimerase [Pontiella sulfatireligans]
MKNLIINTLSAAVCITVAGCSTSGTTVSNFSTIREYTLRNKSGMEVRVSNYGATITSIVVPDRVGNMADVALGYNMAEGYINAVDRPYFGSVIGRYSGTIADGKFQLDGKQFQLPVNKSGNHENGGSMGFDKVVWQSRVYGNSIEFKYLSKDLEEGYQGNLSVKVIYTLYADNTLQIEYYAETDKATPVNLSNRTYINLAGEGNGTILSHELMINSEAFTPVNEKRVPTGEIRSVKGTPFDFRIPKPIGRDIGNEDEQLLLVDGYDQNWVLSKGEGGVTLAASIYEPGSGRTLQVSTMEPGLRFYSGNGLDGRLKGKSGKRYSLNGGFCLEPRHFPDSPNHSQFPTTILRPGEQFKSISVYKFGVK